MSPLASGLTLYATVSSVANSFVTEMVTPAVQTWVGLCEENGGITVRALTSATDWIPTTEGQQFTGTVGTGGGNYSLASFATFLLAGIPILSGLDLTVYKSTDTGATWTLKQTIDEAAITAACFFKYMGGTTTLYMGTMWGGHLWTSTDAGESFTDQGQFNGEASVSAVWDMHDLGAGTWLAVTAENNGAQSPMTIWKTTDSGGTWTAEQTGITFSCANVVDRPAHFVATAAAGTVLCIIPNSVGGGAHNDSIWRTTDSGDTWSLVSGTAGYGRVAIAADGLVGCRRTTANGTNIIGTFSDDDGATWTDVGSAQAGNGAKSMGVRSNGDVLVAAGRVAGAENSTLYSLTADVVAQGTTAYAWIGAPGLVFVGGGGGG